MSAPANFGDTRPLIEPAHAVMLRIDQPGGLFEDHDMPMQTRRAKLGTLAKAATLARVPVIATVCAPPGRNAPLIPEIRWRIAMGLSSSNSASCPPNRGMCRAVRWRQTSARGFPQWRFRDD